MGPSAGHTTSGSSATPSLPISARVGMSSRTTPRVGISWPMAARVRASARATSYCALTKARLASKNSFSLSSTSSRVRWPMSNCCW